MENLNLPKFYIGQKIVCISSNGTVIKGNVYTCMGVPDYNKEEIFLKELPGLQGYPYRTAFARRFKPIQESKFLAVSFEKIMEETEKICVN